MTRSTIAARLLPSDMARQKWARARGHEWEYVGMGLTERGRRGAGRVLAARSVARQGGQAGPSRAVEVHGCAVEVHGT